MKRPVEGGVRIVLALLLALAAAPPLLRASDSPSPADPHAQFDTAHRVEFPGLVPPLDLPLGRPNTIQGYLFRPATPGPHPAVVLLTGCRGLRQYPGYRRWVDHLVSWDYVALVVDSLETRGVDFCNQNQRVDRATTAGDAYGAFLYLSGQTGVVRSQIALIGYQFGGASALFAIESNPANYGERYLASQYPELEPLAFRAAVALYPTYFVRRQRFSAPLLILDGDGDRLPRDRFLEMWWLAETSRRLGDRTQFHVYPDATHGFDMEVRADRYDSEIRFDPAATADAVQRVRDFLREYLKQPG